MNSIARSLVAASLAATCVGWATPGQAQHNDPKNPYNVAQRFMEQTYESRAKLAQVCLAALGGSSAAKAVIDRVTGAAVNAASRAAAWTAVIVVGATAGVCAYEYRQQLPKIRAAWRAMDAGALTLDAKIDAMRLLAGETFMLEGLLWAAQDMMSERADSGAYSELTLKDIGEDLLRLRQECEAAADPERSAACGSFFGNDIPADAAIRKQLAIDREVFRCSWERINNHNEEFDAIIAGCRAFAESQLGRGQFGPIRATQSQFPNPYGSYYGNLNDRKVAQMNAKPHLLFFGDLVDRLTVSDAIRVHFILPDGQGQALYSDNQIYFRGYKVNLKLRFDTDTKSTLFGKPTGGTFEINGMKFSFGLIYDKNGNLAYDEQGHWEFTLMTPDGQLYGGSSSGGGGTFRKGVKPLRAFATDQRIGVRLQFDGDGRASVRVGDKVATIDPKTGLFFLDGAMGQVQGGEGGRTLFLYTSEGIESYPVDATGRLAGTLERDGTLRVRGRLLANDGTEQNVTLITRADGIKLRVITTQAGAVVLQETIKLDGSSQIVDQGGNTIYKDKNGNIFSTFACESGQCTVCALFDKNGIPRQCSNGEQSWNPNDGWNGQNPFRADVRNPPDWCVGLAQCYTDPLWYRLLYSDTPGDTWTTERCWEEFVMDRDPKKAWETVRDHWQCGSIAERATIFVDASQEVDTATLRDAVLHGSSLVLGSTPEVYSLPRVTDPTTGASAQSCQEVLGNRMLMIQRFQPDSSIVDVAPACLTAVTPFTVDFLLPSGLAPALYVGQWREATSGRALKNTSAFNVLHAPSITTVNAMDYSLAIERGRFGAGFGQGMAAATVTAPGAVSEVCYLDLGGRAVRIAGQLACLLYVSPTQINFQVPPDVTPGQYDVRLYDTGQAQPSAPYGKEIARSTKFVVTP